jgi:hypothetical protein
MTSDSDIARRSRILYYHEDMLTTWLTIQEELEHEGALNSAKRDRIEEELIKFYKKLMRDDSEHETWYNMVRNRLDKIAEEIERIHGFKLVKDSDPNTGNTRLRFRFRSRTGSDHYFYFSLSESASTAKERRRQFWGDLWWSFPFNQHRHRSIEEFDEEED